MQEISLFFLPAFIERITDNDDNIIAIISKLSFIMTVLKYIRVASV